MRTPLEMYILGELLPFQLGPKGVRCLSDC